MENLINIDPDREVVKDLFSQFLKEKGLYLHRYISPDYGNLKIEENSKIFFRDNLSQYIRGMHARIEDKREREELRYRNEALRNKIIEHFNLYLYSPVKKRLIDIDDLAQHFTIEVDGSYFIVSLLPIFSYEFEGKMKSVHPGDEDYNDMPQYSAEITNWEISFKLAVKL